MGISLVNLQTKVFDRFGDVKISVQGPPTEQIQEILKTLDLPEDKFAKLGENPFTGINSGDMVFLFEAPAYLGEVAMLEIMGAFAQKGKSAYHLQLSNGRPLQIYALDGRSTSKFIAKEATPLSVSNILPIDTLTDFHNLREHIRKDIILNHVENGISIKNPDTVSIDQTVTIGEGTVIEPGTIIKGHTEIGRNTQIGPYTVIESCKIGDDCMVVNSTLNLSALENNVRIGPYANIRPGCHLGNDVIAGSFVELKNAQIGEKTSIPHLSYVGDAELGKHINVGCGCVTANFNGVTKHITQIEDNAFVGCNSVLVAPVNVGASSIIAAGSVVTDDVPSHSLAVARSRQINKEDWALDRAKNW